MGRPKKPELSAKEREALRKIRLAKARERYQKHIEKTQGKNILVDGVVYNKLAQYMNKNNFKSRSKALDHLLNLYAKDNNFEFIDKDFEIRDSAFDNDINLKSKN